MEVIIIYGFFFFFATYLNVTQALERVDIYNILYWIAYAQLYGLYNI